MSRYKIVILTAVLVCQIGALAGIYLNSIYPHYLGEEVTLNIVPVDPRSLFRGQYARLAFDIGTIPLNKLSLSTSDKRSSLRSGEIVYVALARSGDVHVVEHIQIDKPEKGLFIRGRIERQRSISRDKEIQVIYGIEAYFAAPKKAIEVEQQARSRDSLTLAQVMIAPNGKAALVDIVSHYKH